MKPERKQFSIEGSANLDGIIFGEHLVFYLVKLSPEIEEMIVPNMERGRCVLLDGAHREIISIDRKDGGRNQWLVILELNADLSGSGDKTQ